MSSVNHSFWFICIQTIFCICGPPPYLFWHVFLWWYVPWLVRCARPRMSSVPWLVHMWRKSHSVIAVCRGIALCVLQCVCCSVFCIALHRSDVCVLQCVLQWVVCALQCLRYSMCCICYRDLICVQQYVLKCVVQCVLHNVAEYVAMCIPHVTVKFSFDASHITTCAA